ncbi:MAG TPA: TPM domain-containing protein [Tepidisphaeraceae bacterium]|nr:TPM domain-containing protein [Tepidisphaeraceae bacterium]
MKRTINSTAILAVVLLLTAYEASAGIHEVWDQAHFFKPETIVQVDQILADIHEKYHKDLMIETFASIPDDFKTKYQQDGKEKFFKNWASSEGATLQLNGLIVLICGDPRHVQIELGQATRQKAFTEADRDELIGVITAAFKAKDFDKGIVVAARFVRDRMDKNLAGGDLPTTRPTSQSSESK